MLCRVRRWRCDDRDYVRWDYVQSQFIKVGGASRVIDFEEGRVVEWKHPLGHHWRWEFTETTAGHTEVTEVFDYSMVRFPQWVEWMGFRSKDEQGITATLEQLRARYADG
ncbi:hypothetical protein DEU38_11519 [Rhodococcus sp. AG1013]|nr:hypothetical protein DEU38_11519 [Rhodococcus sp. AG1013]